MPSPLERLATAASGTVTLRRMRAAWQALRPAGQPRLIAARLDGALGALARAVSGHRSRRALQASLDTTQSVLDLQLRHRPRGAVDRDRFELWCQQVRVDAAARDSAAVSGDVATLGWIRDRIAYTLSTEEMRDLDAQLGNLQAAADGRRLAAAADHAARLIGLVRESPRL